MNLTLKSAVRLTAYKIQQKDLKGFIRQFKYLLSVIKQQLNERLYATKYRFKIQEDILIQRNLYANLDKYYNREKNIKVSENKEKKISPTKKNRNSTKSRKKNNGNNKKNKAIT